MGGGRRFPFPKHVWSPAGGWWANPENWKRNTAILMTVNWTLAIFAYQWAEGKTQRYSRTPAPHTFVPISERGHEGGEGHHH